MFNEGRSWEGGNFQGFFSTLKPVENTKNNFIPVSQYYCLIQDVSTGIILIILFIYMISLSIIV